MTDANTSESHLIDGNYAVDFNVSALLETTRMMPVMRGSISEIVCPAGHEAFRIARHAGAAHFWPHVVNPAGGGFTDFARQRRATNTDASHAALVAGNVFGWNKRKLLVVFSGKSRPLG